MRSAIPKTLVAAVLLLLAAPLGAPAQGAGEGTGRAFEFVALGDTAYNGERDYVVYRALIERINAAKPAFTIHVGDVWGAGSCADWHVERIAAFFARYDHPVVYTPGDNEWIDCANPAMGGFDPIERLAKLRAAFFADDRTLGAKPMRVVRQSDVSPFEAFVENARWERDGVLFVTVHVVGSDNHFAPSRKEALLEFHERDRANVAWLDDAFRIAREQDYRAVVVALHAEMFRPEGRRLAVGSPGHRATAAALRRGADRFGRPVLLVHGDAHHLTVDRPFLEYVSEEEPPRHANLTRLQVYGAPEIRALRVRVEPDTPWVFGFTPLHD